MIWEDSLNNIKKHQGRRGCLMVKSQLKLWCKDESHIFKTIKDYIILDFRKITSQNEFLVVRNDFEIYKSFENPYHAIDYCLDKINTESKQLDLI